MESQHIGTGDVELDQLINNWLLWDKNEKDKKEVMHLIETKDVDKLKKIFGSRLEFGTAGLRGVMAAGPSRMNDLTVIQASQGMAKYLLECFQDVCEKGVVIGFDARYNSTKFAHLAARAFVSKGIPVKLFSSIVPTPFIPFAVCKYGTKAGIVVTASHNPKEDNGYKVYWDNGAQLLSPHDKNILRRSLDCLAPWEEAWNTDLTGNALVSDPYKEINELYFSTLSDICIKDPCNTSTSLKFTYTPVHGVGAEFVKQGFQVCKLKPYIPVAEQIVPDPDFTTVYFPNPEERETLKLALKTGSDNQSTIVIANDPDADRLAVAELQANGEWRIFTGNELGALLGWWMWHRLELKGMERKKCAMISSTVSSKILQTMAKQEGFAFEETLTGFKWIANRALQLRKEGVDVLFGFEEALGFMCGLEVPDKDGVSAASHLAELAVYLEKKGSTLTQQLNQIFATYGHHVALNSYYLCYDPVAQNKIFYRLRNFGNESPNTYPKSLMNGRYTICGVRDLTTGYDSRQADGKATLPTSSSSHMITFYFDNGLEATIRSSGTEPKIKYYTELRAAPSITDRQQVEKTLEEMVAALVDEFLQPTVHNLTPRPE